MGELPAPRRNSGYTLLEMVIVLAIMAMATAMVAPVSYRMIASWREAGQANEVMGELAALPVKARIEGRELRLPANDPDALAALIQLPEAWQLRLDQPMTVRANGACSGSLGTLETERQTLRFEIQAPFCKVQRLADDRP